MNELGIFKLDTSKRVMVPLFEEGVYCGDPTEVGECPEIVDLNELITSVHSDTFVGVVHGESMIEFGFYPGDMLVVDRNKTAKNGDTVVAYIDGEFTVKLYHYNYKTKTVTLVPANQDLEPIVVDLKSTPFAIWGVVVKNIQCVKSGLTIIKARTAKKEENAEEVMPPAIDERELRFYFKTGFRGVGKANVIDCIPNLMATIERGWTAYKHAMIAKLIYDCPYMANRPSTYSKWYRKYCTIVGCEYKPSYKPNKVKPTEDVKKAFSILE